MLTNKASEASLRARLSNLDLHSICLASRHLHHCFLALHPSIHYIIHHVGQRIDQSSSKSPQRGPPSHLPDRSGFRRSKVSCDLETSWREVSIDTNRSFYCPFTSHTENSWSPTTSRSSSPTLTFHSLSERQAVPLPAPLLVSVSCMAQHILGYSVVANQVADHVQSLSTFDAYFCCYAHYRARCREARRARWSQLCRCREEVRRVARFLRIDCYSLAIEYLSQPDLHTSRPSREVNEHIRTNDTGTLDGILIGSSSSDRS